MNQLGVFTALKNALSVAARNFIIILVIALVAGGLRDVLVKWGVGWLADAFFSDQKGRALLVYTQLSQLGLATLWGCIIGAWAAPATIYLWVQHEKGQSTSLYESVNYGLNRFRQVLYPHAAAFFWIQIGSIIIVPQILLGIQWAFVDCIATLDRAETHVLSRSRRLTGLLRRRVFLTFLPFLVWWISYQLFLFYGGWNRSLWIDLGIGTVDYLMLAIIDLVMVQYYLDLFRKPQAGPQAA